MHRFRSTRSVILTCVLLAATTLTAGAEEAGVSEDAVLFGQAAALEGPSSALGQHMIYFATNRRIHGTWSTTIPSRFLDELPAANVEITESKGGSAWGGTGGYGASRFDDMTLHPKSLDTIVATNLHADILSDLAGALAGSLGVAPTANIDPQRRFPSMFEPIHGSAFDITGKGIANPVATFWTGAQMLEHLGEKDAAARLMAAVERVCAAGVLTPDVGGKATTKEVTDAVVEAIHGTNV